MAEKYRRWHISVKCANKEKKENVPIKESTGKEDK